MLDGVSIKCSISAKATISSSLRVDLALAHSEDRAVEEDIFASGQFGMKARADFQQAANAAVDSGEAGSGPGDAREQLQQRGFARAVAADQAHHLTMPHFEAHVAQRPDKSGFCACHRA